MADENPSKHGILEKKKSNEEVLDTWADENCRANTTFPYHI